MKAGYIVGDVEGGKFGEHHFNEFWNALNLKEYYDKLKGEAQAQSSSGHYAVGKGLGAMFVGAAGMSAFSAIAAQGSLGFGLGDYAAAGAAYKELRKWNVDKLQTSANRFVNKSGESFYRNREAIDQTVNVAVAAAAAVGAAFTGGASYAIYAGYAAAAYKASIGAVEGGAAGALAGAATGLLAGYGAAGQLGGLNLDISYSYAEGWGAGLGYGWEGTGLSAGLSYNDREGFGVTGGFGLGGLGKGFEHLGLNVGVNQSGGYNAGLNIGNLGDGGRNSLNLGYRYSKFSGGTTSLSYTSGNLQTENFSTTGGLTFNADAGFGVTGGFGWVSQAGSDWRTNNLSLSLNRRGISASYSSRNNQQNPLGGHRGQRNNELTNILAAVADPRLRAGMIARGVMTADDFGMLDNSGEDMGGIPEADVAGDVTSDHVGYDDKGLVSSMHFNKHGNKGANAWDLRAALAKTHGVAPSVATARLLAANGIDKEGQAGLAELHDKIGRGEQINFPDDLRWVPGSTQKSYESFVAARAPVETAQPGGDWGFGSQDSVLFGAGGTGVAYGIRVDEPVQRGSVINITSAPGVSIQSNDANWRDHDTWLDRIASGGTTTGFLMDKYDKWSRVPSGN